ncbi:MAG: endonuclease/exonuclease/phosphatase family protein [Clostridia bacterium]|nr:endonuclease/exonuclease/phosphatase family protein [Clostridia bacterium]
MMKRCAAFLLLLALLVGSVSCGKANTETAETSTAAETAATTPAETEPAETAAPAEDLVIVDGEGKTSFTVVRADEADGMTVNSAIALHTALNDTYKSKVGLSSDISIKKEADGTVVNDKYEILVGDTNRPESIAARTELGDNDYVIRVSGKKLVILGKNGPSTKYAVKLFLEKHLGTAGQALIIPADTLLTGSGEESSVPLTEGADVRIMTFNLRGGEDNPYVRHPNIYETILTYLPDVIGFQEANNGHYPEVLHRLEDYAIVTTEMPTNCTPIIYLKEKYTQEAGGCEFLRLRNTDTGTKSLAWVVLREKETGKLFSVINMHGALQADWRVDNVRQMLERMATVKSQYGDIPVLFTGDFNFNRTEAAYQSMLDASLTEAELSAAIRMEGFGTWHPVGQAPGSGMSIDHIFYHPDDVTALRHHIAMADGFEIKASDHCAVWADVKLLK